METKKVVIDLEYKKEKVNKKGNIFIGGIKSPEYVNEITVDVFEDYVFDEKLDDFLPNGKNNIEIKGSERSLYELGKYLINISLYKTMDKNFHEHIDNICDSQGNPIFNIKISK